MKPCRICQRDVRKGVWSIRYAEGVNICLDCVKVFDLRKNVKRLNDLLRKFKREGQDEKVRK